MHAFIGFVTESVKEIMKETVDMTWKGGRGWRVPKYRSWKNPRANRHYSRGINRIRLDGDEWFRTRAGWWGRRPRSSSARKQTDITQSGRSVLSSQDCFWLLYGMDPSMIWARKQKQMVEGGLITHRNVFREMKKQNLQTEITMYFHKGTLSVPASPASPSTSSALPSLPLSKVKPSSSSSSSASSARRCQEWRPSWWSTSTQWVVNTHCAIPVIILSVGYVCERLSAKS